MLDLPWTRRVGLLGCLALAPACSDPPSVGGAADSGASDDASGTSVGQGSGTVGADETGMPGRYHPMGFAEPTVHGLSAKLQQEDCRTCHANDLTGLGAAPSCDSCHQDGWRQDCTYCHGGDADPLGAPPRDIDGSSDVASLSFRAHTAHVTDGIHAAFDCVQCHTKPTDVLSEGHSFDDSPGVAEVDFSSGLSPEGMHAAGTCASLYCHGNANGTLGVIDHADPSPGCDGCHAASGSPLAELSGMSGRHALHIQDGVSCSECHGATVDETDSVVGLLLHVNGNAEVVLPAGVTESNGTCTGLCHLQAHFNDNW